MISLDQFYIGNPSAEIFSPSKAFKIEEDDLVRELSEAVLAADPESIPALTILAETCTRIGDYERGLTLDVRLTRLAPENPVVWYNLGCSYSLLGDLRGSLDALRSALFLGYRELDFMRSDPDRVAVRDEPEFEELVAAFSRPKG